MYMHQRRTLRRALKYPNLSLLITIGHLSNLDVLKTLISICIDSSTNGYFYHSFIENDHEQYTDNTYLFAYCFPFVLKHGYVTIRSKSAKSPNILRILVG